MSSREGKAFPSFPFKPFLPEPARRPKSAAERSEVQTPSWTLPASPNMAQTPLCGSAVPMRRFPPVSDLKDAISACIPPRQRKIFAVARLLDADGVLEAGNDAHRRRSVPVALPTTVNAGAYHVAGLAACWGRVPIGTVRHCAISRCNEQEPVRSQLQ